MDEVLQHHFGIDFGTTSSAVVGFSMRSEDGSGLNRFHYGDYEGRPVPSVVAVDRKTGNTHVGIDAWENRAVLSESCEYIPSVKMALGSDKTWKICGKEWQPKDVTACMFEGLRQVVANRTKDVELASATVAIPVGFSAQKRKEVREAAAKAGIEITSFVSEPTAAFFANYDRLASSTNVAVFDWGGGTLDVTILSNRAGKVCELASKGTQLGGDDIDRKMADRLHHKFSRMKQMNLALAEMPSTAQDRLRTKSEEAKRALMDEDGANVNINNYGPYGAVHYRIEYDWFEELIHPEVTRATECLQEAILESGVGMANIDTILLVGGSSNLRLLQETLRAEYGDKLMIPERTAWNVAEGAAELDRRPGVHCSNQSLGLRMSDGGLFRLLAPGDQLHGWTCKHEFGTVDSSSEATIVFAGSPDLDEADWSERTLKVPKRGYEPERIQIRAAVDKDLIVNVAARSLNHTQSFERIWKYDRLKSAYSVPQGGSKA